MLFRRTKKLELSPLSSKIENRPGVEADDQSHEAVFNEQEFDQGLVHDQKIILDCIENLNKVSRGISKPADATVPEIDMADEPLNQTEHTSEMLKTKMEKTNEEAQVLLKIIDSLLAKFYLLGQQLSKYVEQDNLRMSTQESLSKLQAVIYEGVTILSAIQQKWQALACKRQQEKLLKSQYLQAVSREHGSIPVDEIIRKKSVEIEALQKGFLADVLHGRQIIKLQNERADLILMQENKADALQINEDYWCQDKIRRYSSIFYDYFSERITDYFGLILKKLEQQKKEQKTKVLDPVVAKQMEQTLVAPVEDCNEILALLQQVPLIAEGERVAQMYRQVGQKLEETLGAKFNRERFSAGLFNQARSLEFNPKTLNVQLWSAMRENPNIKKMISPDLAEHADNYFGQALLSDIIKWPLRYDDRDNYGQALYFFKQGDVAPLAILNTFRFDSGRQRHQLLRQENTEKPAVAEYVDSFKDEDWEKLRQLQIPGLVEAMEIIKQPWQSKNKEWQPPAQIWPELEKISLHFLERGDDRTRQYIAFGILRDQKNNFSPDFFQKLEPFLLKFSEEQKNDHHNILAALGGRVAHIDDWSATTFLKQYATKSSNHEDFLLLVSDLSLLAERNKGSAWQPLNFRDFDRLLQESLKRNLPAGIVDSLNGYDSLEADSEQLQEFMQSGYLKEHIQEVWLEHKKQSLVVFLLNRYLKFNDQNVYEILCFLAESLAEERDRVEISAAFNGWLRVNAKSLRMSELEDRFKLVANQVLSWVDDPSHPLLVRQAAQIHLLEPDDLLSYAYQDQEKVQARISSLLHSADYVARYFGLRLAQKFDWPPQENELDYLIDSYHHSTELSPYSILATNALSREIKAKIKQLSPEQAEHLIAGFVPQATYDAELAILMSLRNVLTSTQEEKIKDLFNHYPSSAADVKYLVNTEDTEITPDNWARLLAVFLMTKNGDHSDWDEGLAERMNQLFSEAKNKKAVLKEYQELWRQYLHSDEPEKIPLPVLILSQLMVSEHGAGHLKHIQALGYLQNSLRLRFSFTKTTKRTKSEMVSGLSLMEDRFQKEKWSEEEKTTFYDLSRDTLEVAPSLYADFLFLFKDLQPKEMKLFSQELYPLYQANLLIIQKENDGQTTYSARELVELRNSLRIFGKELSGNDDEREKLFLAHKQTLIDNIKESFRKRFGLLKVPDQLTTEHVHTLQNIIRYAGNIHNRDAEKETILSWYLGLLLNNEWQNFRMGAVPKSDEYFQGAKLKQLNDLLKERQSLNPLTAEAVGVPAAGLPKFQALLQDETLNSMIGNVETIDIKLGNVKRNMEQLADEDIYHDPLDKEMLHLLKEHGKAVGETLAKIFQNASGKSLALNIGEEMVQKRLAAIFNVSSWSPDKVKEIQDRIKVPNLIVKNLNNIAQEKIDEEITELQQRLNPPKEIVDLFNRLGEDFKQESGALALSQDLAYLENIITKNRDKLTVPEQQKLDQYLAGIRSQMEKLEAIFNRVKDRFEAIKQGTHTVQDESLKNRLSDIEKTISNQQQSTQILTRMTNDFNVIMENIRACLACSSKEVNNDTNLTFGDSYQFFVMSQSEALGRESIADEIVYLLPAEYDQGGAVSAENLFVFDNIYGNKSSDILVNHIATVFKKYSQIKKAFPESKISLLITQAAMSSVGASPEGLVKNLHDKLEGIKTVRQINGVKVNIVKSVFGDHYNEFSGGVRASGEQSVDGILLN